MVAILQEIPRPWSALAASASAGQRKQFLSARARAGAGPAPPPPSRGWTHLPPPQTLLFRVHSAHPSEETTIFLNPRTGAEAWAYCVTLKAYCVPL